VLMQCIMLISSTLSTVCTNHLCCYKGPLLLDAHTGYYWVHSVSCWNIQLKLVTLAVFRNWLLASLTMYNVPETTISWHYQLVDDLLAV